MSGRTPVRALLGALAAFGLGCGEARSYDRNDLELLTSYTAKEACSCLFVLGQPEQFCAIWTKQNPPLARIAIDHEKKEVRASALVMWGATARFVNEREGCVFED